MTNAKIKVEEVVEIYECLKEIVSIHGKKAVQRILNTMENRGRKSE